ncbi:MAG: hypothetical protein M3389_05545, partial [Actinomycetota bacterium]|nr:hypothetical protein [Actinomycetota bacterium]
HVVWIDEARRLMHCRLPRGATACAAPTAVDGAGPMDDPFVLVHPGGALSVVMAHDGEQRTYAWRSTDGGATWSPRTTIYAFGGEQQPAEPVLGPGPGEVTLAAWTWDRTTGRGQGSVWTASLDGGEAAAATHATFADALDPSLAVTAAGDLLLSAAALDGPNRYRRAAPGADPSQAASWGPQQHIDDGRGTRLATGPSGTYVLTYVPHVDEDTHETLGQHQELRRWTGDAFGPATRIDTPATDPDLHVGPSGAVAAIWYDRGLELALSRDGGATFGFSHLAFDGPTEADVALFSDDSGFAVYKRRRGTTARPEPSLIRVADTEPEEALPTDTHHRFPGTRRLGARLILEATPDCERGTVRADVTAERRGGRRSRFRRIVRVELYDGDRLAATDRRRPFARHVRVERKELGAISAFRAVATVRLRGGRTARTEVGFRYRLC